MLGRLVLIFYIGVLVLAGCQQDEATGADRPVAVTTLVTPKATVVAEGLINPVGLAVLADGTLLIAEEGTGADDLSAGVSARLPSGEIGRLLSNFPSSRDAGDLSGVPFVAVSPDETTLYTSHFRQGRLLTWPLSLPLILPDSPLSPEELTPAMEPLNRVELVNPFSMTFSADGVPIVSDASENGVARETESGQTTFFHRFEPLLNPVDGQTFVDPVPTGIIRWGDSYLVTLTGGCPNPAGVGQLVAIDENRVQRTIEDGLNMPIAVELDAVGDIWLLEFATFDEGKGCFSGEGYEPFSGRLSRLDADGERRIVLTGLNFPGGLRFGPAGELYISEIFSGRILRVDGVKQLTGATAINSLLPDGAALVPAPTDEPAIFTPQFTDVAADVGLDFQHGAFVESLSADPAGMMGAGLCWLDYNNDGWLDLYLVNSHAVAETDLWSERGGLPTNQLYRNVGGQFSDVSEASNSALAVRGNGCVAADFNMDGWTDIFVTVDGPNKLLWNNGNGTFSEGAAAANVATPEWNSAAAVADINRDGWPDLFVAAYIDLEKMIEQPSGAFPQDFLGLPDHFYLNNGDGTFREVTEAVGLLREERGLGALFSDLDGDGDLDLYIANDGHPNRLYLTEPAAGPVGFRFVDASSSSGTNDSGSGMGIAGGDYDADGHYDLLVTNWDTELNALFRNEMGELGELVFRYSTFRIGISGLGNNMTGWGTAWADFDHDTDEDLLVVNGHVPITDMNADAQLVRLYGNRLAEGMPDSFREWTIPAGLGRDGLGPLMARGSAVADFDNDGDLDVAINTIGGPAVLLENQQETGNWLMAALSRFSPGARIEVTLPDGRILVREWHVGSSYLASEDPRLHVGLGAAVQVQLKVIWPDGQIVEMQDVAVNQILGIDPP